MLAVSLILQGMLAVVLVCLALASVQLATLAFIRLFFPVKPVRLPLIADANLPRVLVQLPVCDEGALALRVAACACRLDWPSDRLEIQVLDDGPAEKHAALIEAIRRLTPEGINLKVLRRGVREGYKAGNLAFGLRQSDAPYVAIFDADFEPPPDFLRRTVPAMVADCGLAYVQARWGHNNRDRNWLTRAQGFLLDSHFAVEQEARFRAGIPFSFNGTAGVWSRKAIEHGGGWTGDTLTEDLDLSVRCALKGWRAAMVGDLEVPSELPDTAAAWRAQQARWTKGHAQVARKLLPKIWASRLPVWKRALLTLQICQFAFYTLAGVSAVISLTLMALGVEYLPSVAMLGLVVTVLGLSASLGYLSCGQMMLGRHREKKFIPTLATAIMFPSGLILSNARATYEAFSGADLVFHRTQRAGEVYRGAWRGRPELAAGVMLPVFALAEQAWSAPFFLFAAAGLVSIGAMGVKASLQLPAPEPAPDFTTAAE
ncbi:MAG TPA: glycosyltransferase family 2 protein [Rhizomicrobium sp.]|jgi:cellulose synthase/poly-beta-1,6-N-acetylglucosamine synthase-like glycosyltransferase